MEYENYKLFSSNFIQNGVDYNAVMSHPDNQDGNSLVNGLPPNSKGEITLSFNMMKDWDVYPDSTVDLYYVYIRGETVEKYRLSVHE